MRRRRWRFYETAGGSAPVRSFLDRAQRRDAQPDKLEANQEGTSPVNTLIRTGYTQTEVADLVGSSQSRVAKMEAGDPTVSVDLLIRTLLALGTNRRQVGRAIGSSFSH